MNKISTQLFALAIFAVLGSSCKDDDKQTVSREVLLAGDSSKSWNISKDAFDAYEEHESCKSTSPRSLDNKWTFYKDHTFKFNNGTITGGPKDGPEYNCTGCCGDFANLKGTWSLFSNQDSLSVIAIVRIDDSVETTLDGDHLELYRVKITKITETQFVMNNVITFTKL